MITIVLNSILLGILVFMIPLLQLSLDLSLVKVTPPHKNPIFWEVKKKKGKRGERKGKGKRRDLNRERGQIRTYNRSSQSI